MRPRFRYRCPVDVRPGPSPSRVVPLARYTSSRPSLSMSNTAMPLPVVSRMYFLVVVPPETFAAVMPAASATSRKSTAIGGRPVSTGLPVRTGRVVRPIPWNASVVTHAPARSVDDMIVRSPPFRKARLMPERESSLAPIHGDDKPLKRHSQRSHYGMNFSISMQAFHTAEPKWLASYYGAFG